MTTDVQPPPQVPEKQNVFSRIAGVFFTPGETFASIARRPDIVGPLLVIVLLGYVSTVLILPKVDYEALKAAQAEQMHKANPDLSEEQLATAGKFASASVKIGFWVAPCLFVAWYAIIAGLLLLAVRLFGGEGRYAQAFSITLYSWMPMLLAGIVMTVVILARGSFDPTTAATLVQSNPAFLVDMKEQPVLFSLLSSFDIFTIWTVALLTIGFAAMSRLSKAKTAMLIVPLWLVVIVIKLGFAAMGAARMKG